MLGLWDLLWLIGAKTFYNYWYLVNKLNIKKEDTFLFERSVDSRSEIGVLRLKPKMLILLAPFISIRTIWLKVSQENAEFVEGAVAGPYGVLLKLVSKQDAVESDHFPPKCVYQVAKDEHTRIFLKIIWQQYHRVFMTAGHSAVSDVHSSRSIYYGNWLKKKSFMINFTQF